MSPQCARGWEAEAIEDGRLAEIARLSFERHSIACRKCAYERKELASLRELGNRLPIPTCTPLEHRRLRASILREGYRQTPRELRSRRAGFAMAAVAAVTLAGGAAFSFVHWGPLKTAPTPAADAVVLPTFEAVPVGLADWRVERTGSEVRAALGAGQVAVHVTKLTRGQRFVVVVPDGELEVHGTRFLADVREGRTRRVEVSEGAVALRLRSAPERTLAAGESWSDELPSATGFLPETSSQLKNAEPMAAPSATGPSRVRTTVKSALAARLGPHVDRASDNKQTSSPGLLFSEAMAVYGAGSFERADKMLAEFHRRFPEDARSEDADFIRVVIRRRLGDRRETEMRARAYLAEYPSGLRRGEIEALLQGKGAP